ncbi:hypothetical protein CEXT_340161 [Caerostris extrusa]|uniref:Uncharacterized protein n=1 Tax=Caerostris extrusa TaxID=172846 RepID=A0AAV4Y1P9_CAEEX|nr:hypothetical protein CEXT_340161 [Caerostris extrusa]
MITEEIRERVAAPSRHHQGVRGRPALRLPAQRVMDRLSSRASASNRKVCLEDMSRRWMPAANYSFCVMDPTCPTFSPRDKSLFCVSL